MAHVNTRGVRLDRAVSRRTRTIRASFLAMAEKPSSERQNEGYDEAARGGKDVPPTNVGIPRERDKRLGDAFDREADAAANDVRRREHSAE